MVNKEERKRLYELLAAPFPSEALERSDARQTGRGYSTTGIRVQYIVDRLCEVLGVGGFRTERSIRVKELTTAKGRGMFEATCELRLQLGEWVDGTFVPFAESLGEGGHVSTSEVDARKGSFGNALKRAAATWGVGRDAYRGTLERESTEGADAPAATAMTTKQRDAILALARRAQLQPSALDELVTRHTRTTLSRLTTSQASALISVLSDAAASRHAPDAFQSASPARRA